MVAHGKNQEQQLQGPRKANQDKTDSYGLDRRYVIPQAKLSDPFPDQNVKAPEPNNYHRDAAERDHIAKDNSLHGQLLPIAAPIARNRRRARNSLSSAQALNREPRPARLSLPLSVLASRWLSGSRGARWSMR